MGKKDRCYLCGAKLQNGYCKECGLDNRRSQKIRYRLNESSATKKNDSFEKMAEEQRETESRNIKKHKALAKKIGSFQTTQRGKTGGGFRLEKKPDFGRKKSRKDEKNAAGKTAAFILTGIGFVGTVIALVSAGVEGYQAYKEPEISVEYTDEPTDGYYDPDEWDGSEPSGELVMTESSDTYEFAKRELSPSGDSYVEYIGYGEYIVGSQIPEGTYTIRLKEGNGYMNVDDHENTIYLWQDFGTNTEYDEILVWQDVRLYEGAIVQVSDNMELEFESENARLEEMKLKDNPLGEEEMFFLEEGDVLTAGEDFEAGIYDVVITLEGGWGLLYINTTTTDPYAEDGYFQNQIWLNDSYSDGCYHNLYIPEGSEIYVEGDGAPLFTPSEKIADIDYTDYYEKYY